VGWGSRPRGRVLGVARPTLQKQFKEKRFTGRRRSLRLASITTLAPATVIAGTSSATTVTVSDTNFLPTTTVQVGGTNRATTYVSNTQVSFQLTVADQAAAGKLVVTAVNATPGGGTSAAATLTVSTPTPTPAITSVSPTQFFIGTQANTIGVYGTNLSSSSVVQWNGTALTTTLMSTYTGAAYLSAVIPATLLTSPGTANITVVNSTANLSTSNAVAVTISNPPAPTLTYISPSAAPINTATPITLVGTGFTAGSTVAFNGVNLTATFVSATEMTLTLPASSVLLPGVGSFTVTTPAPGGGTSAAMAFTSYIGLVNNSMVYNPVNGLLYVSVPSSAGAPYGNSIVSVDPETGAFGTPIPVGSEPNQLAISSDGTILWVGLDGASAVRQVNLTTNTAGLQFTLGNNSGIYATPSTALALAALPGSPNSVVVSMSNALAIYDSGVIRGSAISGTAYALQVNGTTSEIYAGSSNSYNTFIYSSTGITAKASASNGSYASYSSDEMEIAGGVLYTDYGTAYDPESGSLLGTFYNSGTTAASGPTVADTTLGKVFILDDSGAYSFGQYNQIQIFNSSNYTASSSAIPVSVVMPLTLNSYASRLTRWGTNGLAFRNTGGIYSLRSDLVKDLSSVSADLGVTLAATGTNTTGSNTTYTATVTNAGPSAATNVGLTAFLPASSVLISATPSVGTCSTANGVTCDLAGLSSGATATVTFVAEQTTAGSNPVTVQVSGSESDPNTANNQASSNVTISGSTYNLAPTLAAISPAAIVTGAADTTITLTGANFAPGAIVALNGVALTTQYSSSSTLTAIVPAASATTLGWGSVTVSNPTPGGGNSTALPLSFYSVITLGLNHIVYDPFSGQIMASVGSGSTSVTGNSIVAIAPATATVGTAVPIGSQPSNLALTSDGQILYTILSGSESVARFNMLTQQADFTYAVPTPADAYGGIGLRGIATQPGTENTIALSLAAYTGNAIYDFNPTTQTAAIRGQVSGPYTGSCLQFLDANDLLAFDTDTSGATLDHYTVTASGFTYYNYQQFTESTLDDFGCFKVNGNLAFSVDGGVANPGPSPAVQLGVFPISSGYSTFTTSGNVAPDTSLQRTFFAVESSSDTTGSVDSIEAYDNNTYLPSGSLPIPFSTIEGSSSFTVSDLIRWGQDGLAVLTSGGHLYLLSGPLVAPQLLNQNTAASLSSSSASTITHGSGNTLLTLTGGNFVPGVAVLWNGSYRTTTIVDATHVTVAIPASDLTSTGSASLTAVNPGASASSALTITIN
jgi:uncharacterized repeat protein (TIGR01451 family)